MFYVSRCRSLFGLLTPSLTSLSGVFVSMELWKIHWELMLSIFLIYNVNTSVPISFIAANMGLTLVCADHSRIISFYALFMLKLMQWKPSCSMSPGARHLWPSKTGEDPPSMIFQIALNKTGWHPWWPQTSALEYNMYDDQKKWMVIFLMDLTRKDING